MLNESQLRILNLPNVQELIKALDCEVHDSGAETRRKVSNRVEDILTKAQRSEPKPRIMSQDAPTNDPFSDKAAWVGAQKSIHGEGWCPF